MAIYSVHAPSGVVDPQRLIESVRVERQGFAVCGLVFGPLWLLARGLWRPLGLWIVAAIVVRLAVMGGALGVGAAFDLYALSALLIGFEGRAMREAALARRGLPLVDVAVGADPDAAERAFAARALVAPPAPGPASPPPSGRYSPPPENPHGIIGLFPEAGG